MPAVGKLPMKSSGISQDKPHTSAQPVAGQPVVKLPGCADGRWCCWCCWHQASPLLEMPETLWLGHDNTLTDFTGSSVHGVT